jgi:hypothetical protein
MLNGNPPGVFFWSLGMMGAGSAVLAYAVNSVRRGWFYTGGGRFSAGRPPRDVHSSKEPAEFWAGVILLTLFGGGFLTIGFLVFTRQIVFRGS